MSQRPLFGHESGWTRLEPTGTWHWYGPGTTWSICRRATDNTGLRQDAEPARPCGVCRVLRLRTLGLVPRNTR